MNNKQNLTNIFNVLAQVETKGESTLILADCRRSLAGIIQNIPDEVPEDTQEKKDKQQTGK